MYKLIYFKATNAIGFISGTGKRTFELDLDNFTDRDLMVVSGDNASGKSTFLSMVHPWHTPSDGRSPFIVKGKEGTLIRKYRSDDGTVITTRCIYTPKSGDNEGHNAKCFFEVEKPNGDKTEMNPNGNVQSYQSLLYTYFGLNKDFISFATYNTAVADIVKMTDGERKNSVSSLIPNVGRYDTAYTMINEKYKELRALLRNVSQKILNLRDEDSLRSDLKRITKEINEYASAREDAVKKSGKVEGRLRELTHGEDVDVIITEYRELGRLVDENDKELGKIVHELHMIYNKLGIDYKPDSIEFDGIDNVQAKCSKLEAKVARLEASLAGHKETYQSLKDRLYEIENHIMEQETLLYSVQSQNVDDLIALQKEYLEQLRQMKYASRKDEFKDMSYDEVVSFSRSIGMIYTMIQALYDEYGELIAKYFRDMLANGFEEKQIQSISALKITIDENTSKRDRLFKEFVEKDQYRRFQAVLDQRPKSCTIDSCPFIANAMKWKQMSGEVEKLKSDLESLDAELQTNKETLDDYNVTMALYGDVQKLRSYIEPLADLIKKYYGLTIEDVYKSIINANWTDVISVIALKDIAAILSEKDLYDKIINQSLPEVEHSIEMAKLYGTNRQLIQTQLDSYYKDRDKLNEEIKKTNIHTVISSDMLARYRADLKEWDAIRRCLSEYTEVARKQLSMTEKLSEHERDIGLIDELQKQLKSYEVAIEEIDRMIADRMPVQQKMKMDLLALDQLKQEKIMIENDFVIVDIIRSIVQPGRGLRKELINIYMFDIYQTANQLLLNTFNGNLYLKEFIITDKEFIIPYVYNGTESPDISYASASQQAAISISISMAILSKIMGDYGIVCFDEADAAFSPANRDIFIDVLTTQMRFIGIRQGFLITQNPADYINKGSVGYILFPGASKKNLDKDDIIDVLKS